MASGPNLHTTSSTFGLITSPFSALRVAVPARGLSSAAFELLVGAHGFPSHLAQGRDVVFTFAANAFLPAGLGLWLLSYFNQLATYGPGRVCLEFECAEGLFGYLDRNGFLQLLSPRIVTSPARPAASLADRLRGQAESMVEIVPLRPGTPLEEKLDIVGPLVRRLMSYFPVGDERTSRLESHVFTLLGELVDNVFTHSEMVLPGYVSLQGYRRSTGPRIQVSVSDSGVGIPASIRASLGGKVGSSTDAELVLQAFSEGLSRLGQHAGRGCGLRKCASLAAQYGSTVTVRTPASHVTLRPAGEGGSTVHEAEVFHVTGAMAGTHLVLEFRV